MPGYCLEICDTIALKKSCPQIDDLFNDLPLQKLHSKGVR